MDGVPAGRRPAGRTAGRGLAARACPGALDLAVGDAARTLAGLDLARWNPEVPALLAGLGEDRPGARAARRPRPARALGAGPGAAAGRRPRPRDGRRARGGGQPRPGRRAATRRCARSPTPSGTPRPPRSTGSRGEPSAVASSAAMTEPITMNRVIHDAVRRDLDAAVHRAGAARDGDRARAAELDRAYAYLRGELTRHHEGEDDYVWPLLATVGVDAGPPGDDGVRARGHVRRAGRHRRPRCTPTRPPGPPPTPRPPGRASSAPRRSSNGTSPTRRGARAAARPAPRHPGVEGRREEAARGVRRVAGSFFAWLTDGMSDADRAYLRSTVPPPVVTVLSTVLGRSYTKQIAPVWRNGS